MESRDFCYWLQGFMEMSGAKTLDEKQVAMLKKHLALTFVNVTDQPQDTTQGVIGVAPGVTSGLRFTGGEFKIC